MLTPNVPVRELTSLAARLVGTADFHGSSDIAGTWRALRGEGANKVVRTIVSGDLQMVMIIAFDRHAPTQRIAALVDGLMAQPQIVQISELEGNADLMVEAALPNLAAYHDFVTHHIDHSRRYISRLDTHFVCRRYVREADDEDVVWAQGRGGVRPISLSRVDCIQAEGDYVRLFVDGEQALLHSTLQAITMRLPPTDFVQIHRSTVVRRASIRRLFRCGRRWQVELPDHSTHTIAKTRVAELSGAIESARSNRLLSGSSNSVPANGAVEPV